MKLFKLKNIDEFVEKSVEAIETHILEELNYKPILRIALSGGSSPIPVYKKLAESKKIPWSRITLFLVDERYVPLNSKESNYKMIKETLVDSVKNLRKFYYYNTREPITIISHQYEQMLRQFDFPLFDLVILGLGEDGHTASIFPHSDVIREESRLVMKTVKPDDAQDRITLTFPAILSSNKIIFLIRGENKGGIIDQLCDSNANLDDLPAKKVMEHSDVEIFFGIFLIDK